MYTFKAKYFQFRGKKKFGICNVMPLRTSALEMLILGDEKSEHYASITFLKLIQSFAI